MRRWLVILLILLIIPVSQPVLSGSNGSDAPYIQYYSDYLNAFVIERADGTDSRVLGEGLFPPDTWSVSSYDMRWSPSGEWLAFSPELSRHGTMIYPPRNFTVMNRDGQRVLQSIGEIGPVETAFWPSPHDILLAVGPESSQWDSENDVQQVHYYLIDASIDTIINELEIKISVPLMEVDFAWYSQFRSSQWNEETQQLVVVYIDPLPRILWVHFLGLDGTISSRQFPMPEEITFDFKLLLDGWLLYPNIDQHSEYILLNLFDGTTFEYRLEAPASITQLDDLPYVLIKDAIREHDQRPRQWDNAKYFLLDLRDFSMTLLGTFPIRSTFRWTDDGQFIVFDFSSTLYIYDVKNDRFNGRSLFFDPRIQTTQRQYRLRDETDQFYVMTFERDANGEYQNKMHIYDLATGRVEQIEGLPHNTSLYSFAPDFSHYLTFGVEGDKLTYHITPMDDGETVEFAISPRKRFPENVAALQWHEEGDWFFLHEAFIGNDSAVPYYRWHSIANMDGFRREVTYCDNCTVWLPENVNADKLPDGQPTSVLPVVIPPFTLPGSGEILWHEDYIKVDSVVYNIETGDVVSLPDYDISFSSTDDVELSFDHFPYRIEEAYDGTTFMAVIDQASGEIVKRFVYMASRVEPGKLIVSRNIFIQPTYLNNGLLLIWDMEHGEIVANLPIPAVSVSVSPDEEHVALQMAHDQIQVWSLDELLSLGIMVPPREVPLDYDFGIEQ